MASPRSKAFMVYLGLWLAELFVGLARRGVSLSWIVPVAISVLLLVGLARGSRIAWALLLIDGILGVAAAWILTPRGGDPAAMDLVIAAFNLAQVALLLSPWLSPWSQQRKAGPTA